MSIGERIRQRRRQLEITQTELSDAVGVTQNQIWRYESGVSIPYADVAAKIATHLNTTTDWLLGLSDEVEHISDEFDLTQSERELIQIIRDKSPDAAIKLIDIAKVI